MITFSIDSSFFQGNGEVNPLVNVCNGLPDATTAGKYPRPKNLKTHNWNSAAKISESKRTPPPFLKVIIDQLHELQFI